MRIAPLILILLFAWLPLTAGDSSASEQKKSPPVSNVKPQNLGANKQARRHGNLEASEKLIPGSTGAANIAEKAKPQETTTKAKIAAGRIDENDNRPVYYGKEPASRELNSRQIFFKGNRDLKDGHRQIYYIPKNKEEVDKGRIHSPGTKPDPYQGHNFQPRYWSNVKPRHWTNVKPRHWKNVQPRHIRNFRPHGQVNVNPVYGENVKKNNRQMSVRAFRYNKNPDEVTTLARVKKTGKLRIGVYLQFKGLSFMRDGKPAGLDIALAKLMCEKLSEEVEAKIEPEFVSVKWVDIVRDLRGKRFDVVFSALIPSPEYGKYRVTYSSPYLVTGPVVCCQSVNGKPKGGLDGKVASLKDKRIVIINDPAARKALRCAGVYVPDDSGKLKTNKISFPLTLTRRAMSNAGEIKPTVPVKQVIQLENIDKIYQMLAGGKVDAGVIDLPIVWWASRFSGKYRNKIHVFRNLVANYELRGRHPERRSVPERRGGQGHSGNAGNAAIRGLVPRVAGRDLRLINQPPVRRP